MANGEHLTILENGVRAWNQWRFENPQTIPDLSRANLSEANLNRANLSEADLREADLYEADLRGANLHAADLREANLREANLYEADLRGANLYGANLSRANLSEANLTAANLQSADLNEAILSTAQLSGAVLNKAHLYGADLHRANLDVANLSEANLQSADLTGADLRAANLYRAILYRADLNKANLSEANLSEANLSRANLSGTQLSGANLRGAGLSETIVAAVDLSRVKGLEEVVHKGPSTVGINAIYESKGKIPEVFLRGCGVPDDMIDFVRGMLGKAIEFYSCFISYSSKDEAFAKRVYADLQDKGVRVWFAPEDVKGGEKLYEQINRAIQFQDKLLLVLSENSLQSEWVMTEIRRAREVEIEEKRRKLFPIRLVALEVIKQWECFDADSGRDLAVEMREYFIPDFSNWKDHDSYQKAFDRLLRDLRASEAK